MKNHFVANNFDRPCVKADFEATVLPCLEKLCRNMASFKASLTKGYSVGFENAFVYSPVERFQGLYLALRSPKGQLVGVLRFKIGFPLVIHEIQGSHGELAELPLRFFRETGKNFDIALVEQFTKLVGTHLRFRSPPAAPKVVFFPRVWAAASAKAKRRLVLKYCPRSALKIVEKEPRPGTIRIKEKCFVPHRRHALPR
jgi:hypothetical protein